MDAFLVGPIIRSGPGFAYPIFDGKTVTPSFLYPRIDQARYARDREPGKRFETMDSFDGAIATIH
jgi:hypothetical protein